MKIDAETYREAAREHATLARELYTNGHYVYAVYIAGVSVECMLRAEVAGDEFDSRHDLRSLLRDSRLLQTVTTEQAATIAAALGNLWARWRNTHRYLSVAGLKRYVVDHRLHIRVKGDPVKETARIAVESSLIILGRGTASWLPR